ncbi:MAG: beta-lactamase family protein, partial [Parvularculaceae bacterium]|nr:beta-lactamase family protein [Parvularculaceae bacterium]
MRFSSVGLLVSGVLFAVLASGGAAAEQKTFLGVAEAARDAGFEGVAILGDRDGPVISAVSGQARPGVKHDIDFVWPWASATKQVTAVLVMQDVERRRLSLDQSLASALPEFKGANAARITLRHLLRHRSGLPNPEAGAKSAVNAAPELHLRPRAAKRQIDAANEACAGPAAAEPGARVEANACDFILLGAVLERLNGAAYGDLVRTRIAEPLGLASLTVAPRKRPKSRDVVGHDGPTVSPPLNEATYGAAGALLGAPEDLLTFDRALVDGRLLGDAAQAELWAGDPAEGYAAIGAAAFPATLAGC